MTENPIVALEGLADLCGLGLDPSELPGIEAKLLGILSKFESIQGLDLKGLAEAPRRASSPLREDGRSAGCQDLARGNELLELNAPLREEGADGGSFYRVPSILDN